jgi:hypothetical protein
MRHSAKFLRLREVFAGGVVIDINQVFIWLIFVEGAMNLHLLGA